MFWVSVSVRIKVFNKPFYGRFCFHECRHALLLFPLTYYKFVKENFFSFAKYNRIGLLMDFHETLSIL